MKKYQWNDAKLQKDSNLYFRLSLGLGVLALIVLYLDASVWWLLLLLIGVVMCFVLEGRVKDKDKQLKPKEK